MGQKGSGTIDQVGIPFVADADRADEPPVELHQIDRAETDPGGPTVAPHRHRHDKSGIAGHLALDHIGKSGFAAESLAEIGPVRHVQRTHQRIVRGRQRPTVQPRHRDKFELAVILFHFP